MQVQGMVVEEFKGEGDVADEDAERWRHAADRHLDRHGGRNGMNTAADAARAARDVEGIAWVAADHDHLVATKQRRHRPSLDDLASVEVGDRVERKCARDSRDRIEIDLFDEAITPKELLDVFGRELGGHPSRHGGARRVGVGDTRPEIRLALRVELDREILEAHGVLSGSAKPEYPGGSLEMAVGGLQPSEQRTERPVDCRELLGQWARVVADSLEPVGDGGDAASSVEQSPGNRDQVARERQDDERDGDEGQRQEHQRLPEARSASTVATVPSFFSMAPATPSISVPTVIVASSALMSAVFRTMPPAACNVSAAYSWIDRADRHVRCRE